MAAGDDAPPIQYNARHSGYGYRPLPAGDRRGNKTIAEYGPEIKEGNNLQDSRAFLTVVRVSGFGRKPRSNGQPRKDELTSPILD